MTKVAVNFDENRVRAAPTCQRQIIGNMNLEGRGRNIEKKPSRIDRARGDRISNAMRDQGYYYNCQLCYDLDVSESTLSRWRSGLPLSLNHAVSLAEALHISLDYLLLGTSPKAMAGTLDTQLSKLETIYRKLDQDRTDLLTRLVCSLACQSASGLRGGQPCDISDEPTVGKRQVAPRQQDSGTHGAG